MEGVCLWGLPRGPVGLVKVGKLFSAGKNVVETKHLSSIKMLTNLTIDEKFKQVWLLETV